MVDIGKSNGPSLINHDSTTCMENTLGVYIHIPFCIQRCSYCDFATYAKDQIAANDAYVEAVCTEIRCRQNIFSEKKLSTIYFGGGTPSLLTPEQIKKIIDQFKTLGFEFLPDIEITLEVNPATLSSQKCEGFRQAGVNRISIGCQSFNDDYLKACNREHNVQDTLHTIDLVQSHFTNYSLDLLFSLPQQGLEQLEPDLLKMQEISPPHISAYCLTLPEKHPMNQGRCSDEEQAEMFDRTLQVFGQMGMKRYEISNFSKPGFESRHNNLYWTDQNYWGVGLSAHSYKRDPHWGYRFWNPSSYQAYMQKIQDLAHDGSLETSFSKNERESLMKHESLSDFCHTHLRLHDGLNLSSVRHKYGEPTVSKVADRLVVLEKKGWLNVDRDRWRLSDNGLLVSNQVFSGLLFSAQDIDN